MTLGRTIIARWMQSAALGVYLASLPAPVSAQSAEDDGSRSANSQALQALVLEAQRAFRDGDYARAVTLLNQVKRAYGPNPDPNLDSNLGRAYENLGNLPKAIEAYEEYLSATKDAPDRGTVEAHVQALKRQLSERQAFQQVIDRRTDDQRHAVRSQPDVDSADLTSHSGRSIV